MNELTGAVARTQLDKLDRSVRTRMARAEQLSSRLAGLPGIGLPLVAKAAQHSYWKYCLDIDPGTLAGGTDALAQRLRGRGIFCAPRYIQKPAFQCQVLRDQCTFGKSRYPFTLARDEALDYRAEKFPGTFLGLSRVLVIPWNEGYSTSHVDAIADCIREAVHELSTEA
jgi:dTDP-4-amino-4,6-dideoxygalactose transaminase